jgi:hypothetical protein
MVRSHAAAEAVITEKGLPCAAAKATKAAASETAEAATAASRSKAGTPNSRLRADARGCDGRHRERAA